jgi:hypothetical protein
MSKTVSRLSLSLVGTALLVLNPGLLAHAQLLSFLSTGGNDANDCSRAAPCLTFSTAYTKTAAGGVISCLDTNVSF